MFIDHIHFYVKDAIRTRDCLIEKMGFQQLERVTNHHTHSEIISNQGSIFFVVSSPINTLSPVYNYLKSHASGIADVAFRVKNIESILNKITSKRTTIIKPPKTYLLGQKQITIAKIKGWNSLEHTLIENRTNIPFCLLFPNLKFKSDKKNIVVSEQENHWLNKSKLGLKVGESLTAIDHLVLNVAKGELVKAAQFYHTILGFKYQQHFQIKTNYSGLHSQVLLAPKNDFYFNINEPTSANSQIQQFIDYNGGSGIQHIALKSTNIINTVTQMRHRGLCFLPVQRNYYNFLKKEGRNGLMFKLTEEEWKAIETQHILVDFDTKTPESLLMQIFTKPIFNEPTFFFELIERRQQARGFGEGNFQALFEIMEKEQIKSISTRRKMTTVLNLEPITSLTREKFYQLCLKNPELQLERTPQGELIIMSPVGGKSGKKEADLIGDLIIWNRQTKLGVVFSSYTIFSLPKGGDRSPDVAWVSSKKWEGLTQEEREGFPPICPDFVIELRSKSDRLKPLQAKMQEYLDSGLRLGWLINPQQKQIEIYRPQQAVEIMNMPATLSGENVLPELNLSLDY